MHDPKRPLTDEQRVALWLAKRGHVLIHSGKRKLTTADMQMECTTHWHHYGIYRLPSTWLRAFWRAAAAGMLGTVTKGERVHGLYVYSYTATKRDLLRAAGADYKTIKHGKRRAASKPRKEK